MKTKKKVLVMRKVLITGDGNGVGKATAEILKDEKLLLIDIDEKNLKAVAKKLNCDYFVCDVTNVENIESLKQYVEKHFSKIDTLINCAGVWTKGEISQLNNEHFKKLNTLEKLKNIIATNTFGTIAMITAFSPILINNAAVKRGVDSCQIININSQSGVETEEFCPVYNASKHGSYYYRKAVQRDLAKHNVKITDVCPGLIKTDFYIRANDELSSEIMELGLSAKQVALTIKYVFDLPSDITIPSIEIRNIKNY